jgi:hypothetical protein
MILHDVARCTAQPHDEDTQTQFLQALVIIIIQLWKVAKRILPTFAPGADS